MLCDWGEKAGMVSVWVAGKTVWSPSYHGLYLSTLEMRFFIIRHYTDWPYFTSFYNWATVYDCVFCVRARQSYIDTSTAQDQRVTSRAVMCSSTASDLQQWGRTSSSLRYYTSPKCLASQRNQSQHTCTNNPNRNNPTEHSVNPDSCC